MPSLCIKTSSLLSVLGIIQAFSFAWGQPLYTTDHRNSAYHTPLSLYGITLSQTIYYFISFKWDTRANKILVSEYHMSMLSENSDPRESNSCMALGGSIPCLINTLTPSLISLRVRLADTVHVVVLCSYFWDLLLIGRVPQGDSPPNLPWYIPLSPLAMCYTNVEVVTGN